MQARQIAVLTALIFGLLPASPGRAPHVHAQEQMPVSYICTMDPDVLDDKPGTCPICKMTLQPVRIESVYSCTTHPNQSVSDKPGKCRFDKRDLLPMVVNHFWDCGELPEKFYPDPGQCADGKSRVEKKVVRAHGDHNARYGGQFFMASDKWHHLEGTFPSQNLFRVYLFDNFTQPLDIKGISGRAFTVEVNNRELDPVELRPSRDGKTLEAQIKGAGTPSKETPQKVSVRVKFKVQMPEEKFDFTFTELSKAPAAPAATTTTAAAKPAPRTAAAAPATPPDVAPSPAPSTAPAVAAAEPPQAIPVTPPSQGTVINIPGGPTLTQELPNSTAELLKLLDLRAQEVKTFVQEGNFGMVYVPSIQAKDVALALQDHMSELPARQHVPLTSGVRRLVLAAWRLDQYGDLGDREKIAQAHVNFAAAVADIKTAYTSR